MEKYGLVAENPESTIVAKYDSEKAKETKYQSEAELEKAIIKHKEKNHGRHIHGFCLLMLCI